MRRGVLRALRGDRVARLYAALALFSYILIGIAPLWVPAVESGGIEVCSAYGIRVVPSDASPSGDADGGTADPSYCPLCTIQSAFLLPTADRVVGGVGHVASAVVAGDTRVVLAGLFAGFDRLSRAPPLLS